ncbi:deoxyguanosinetriphosphate triphosphohydrolase [Rhodomicrobium sp.]|uniref:deoxyguanosinetriphosphate triphosphohydrolase n=1 Tax=Rhodomicrobium sp. TaxID=2720632 RepID=UPI0039E4986B
MTELAPYAAHAEASLGRLHPEAPCPTRDVYQRDRDRIIHSTAFRRLIHKTQVFIYHEGDHYRTRLTHTLEVAQIARTLARALGLNEDLTEAIALAHDLGHPPFGHAGEDALNEAMASIGGFDHNAQSLRIVTLLEHRYAAFRGMNLTFETLEGIVKHNGPLVAADGRPLARYATSGLPLAIRAYASEQDLRLDTQAPLEGQVAALADDIAYNNHDIDDGFRAGYITVREMEDVPLVARMLAEVRGRYGDLADAPLVYEMNRRMVAAMVQDVLAETRARIAAAAPSSIEDVRAAPAPLAQFSDGMAAGIGELRRFLFARVYKHRDIVKKMTDAQAILRELYDHFAANPAEMRLEARAASLSDDTARLRAAGDFVAGMTDMFAIKAYAAIRSGLANGTPPL